MLKNLDHIFDERFELHSSARADKLREFFSVMLMFDVLMLHIYTDKNAQKINGYLTKFWKISDANNTQGVPQNSDQYIGISVSGILYYLHYSKNTIGEMRSMTIESYNILDMKEPDYNNDHFSLMRIAFIHILKSINEMVQDIWTQNSEGEYIKEIDSLDWKIEPIKIPQ